jgi:hypothetical protein
MIDQIEQAAVNVGISTFITNSEDKIDIQLSRLTRDKNKPTMLVSWDIDVNLSFDSSGFLENPSANIVCLLMSKPKNTTKVTAEETSKSMALKFEQFIQELWKILSPKMKAQTPPLSNVTYKYVPIHGAGKHSGVLGKWTMRNTLEIDC